MGEKVPPTPEQAEAVFAAVLSRPDFFKEAHTEAQIAETEANEYIQSLGDDPEPKDIRNYLMTVTNELDKNCNHVNQEILVSGRVKLRNLNHQLVEVGSEEISRDAIEDSWEPVSDRVATSLGYYALWNDHEYEKIKIYHGASTELERVAYDLRYGAVYRAGRIFIPVDGSAHVEPAYALVQPNWDLLDYYIDAPLMSRIDQALEKETLTDAVVGLGKINLATSNVISNHEKIDPEILSTLLDYVNEWLELPQEIPYRVTGATTIEVQNDEGEWKRHRIDANAAMIGMINSVDIDTDRGRFRLITSMPFDDGTSRPVRYWIGKNLTINDLPIFSLDSKLTIKRR